MNKNEEIRKDKKLGVSFESSKNLKKYVFGDSIDELIDGLELLKDGKFVNEFILKFPDLSEAQLKQLDVLMTKTTNAGEIVRYAIKRKNLSNIENFENTLIKLNSIYDIVEYAEKCKAKNIDKLVDIVIKSDKAYAMTRMAKIEGTDLLKLKRAIFQTNDIYEIIDFCIYCQKNSDIITQEDVQKVEKLVIDYEYERAFYARLASNVTGVNIEKMQEIVIELGDSEDIFWFAYYVEGADIKKLRLAIEKRKNTDWIERFIRKFGPNPDKKKWFFFKK